MRQDFTVTRLTACEFLTQEWLDAGERGNTNVSEVIFHGRASNVILVMNIQFRLGGIVWFIITTTTVLASPTQHCSMQIFSSKLLTSIKSQPPILQFSFLIHYSTYTQT